MKAIGKRLRNGVTLLAVATLVASCGLPRSGPSKREIYSGSVEQNGNAYVVEVTDAVNRATGTVPALGFSQAFLGAPLAGSDVIQPGDTLGLTIWENVDDGLLSGPGANATLLEEVQVDGSGFIFVPYAGRIRAAGNTPESIRGIITDKLEEQTPDPQVQVRRLAGDGATVSLVGAVGAQGVYPIERPTRSLAAMLARAGGVTIEPEIAQIVVLRGNHRGRIWFQDLFANPQLDIALRGGDRILVEEDTRAFMALGATGTQQRVPFQTNTLSALEALSQVGGLRGNSADPTGVFVLREEPAEIAAAVLGKPGVTSPQRMVYVLDLTRPNGLFAARDFTIRDDDTIYVTEAPYVQWNKAISALTGSLSSVNAVDSAAGGLGN
ncbi:polysaccharide export outer membrane protein [Poseidonocella pacifica]|uniref:Polysaccharide export outer membrane protein n=1 Tax=Poseidonocella pacifica TaxID=871651 RepID=A0A1I0V5X5_9RHOB|nr:polysaccharide biosynthesis/export family protein [Poseidonocella pacifica]SFA71652.1 polysaccharide export outer membrane protein [Poseidonocella pacifica]